MNPTDLIFSVVSDLTGGLVTDLTTVIIAMVGFGFILMGLDYLKDAMEQRFVNSERLSDDYQSRIDSHLSESDNYFEYKKWKGKMDGLNMKGESNINENQKMYDYYELRSKKARGRYMKG